jgi:hypothetical protein
LTVFEWANRHGVSQAAVGELLSILEPDRPVGAAGSEASEAAVQSAIQIEAGRRGASLMRNNNGACLDDTGRMVRYGLGNSSSKINRVFKSSDLIGITPRAMPDGTILGIFTAVEVKTPGWTKPKNERERAQSSFLSHVRALGGIGLFAQSVKDVYP